VKWQDHQRTENGRQFHHWKHGTRNTKFRTMDCSSYCRTSHANTCLLILMNEYPRTYPAFWGTWLPTKRRIRRIFLRQALACPYGQLALRRCLRSRHKKSNSTWHFEISHRDVACHGPTVANKTIMFLSIQRSNRGDIQLNNRGAMGPFIGSTKEAFTNLFGGDGSSNSRNFVLFSIIIVLCSFQSKF